MLQHHNSYFVRALRSTSILRRSTSLISSSTSLSLSLIAQQANIVSRTMLTCRSRHSFRDIANNFYRQNQNQSPLTHSCWSNRFISRLFTTRRSNRSVNNNYYPERTIDSNVRINYINNDNDDEDNDVGDNSDDNNKRLKRKVLLSFCYAGTKYNGLQYQLNESIHARAIENIIFDALHSIDCITASNSVHPRKVKWSRSSRTDKGVHAINVIIACKLELDPSWFVDDDSSVNPNRNHKGKLERVRAMRFDKVVELLNNVLPPDIKALSCVRIHNNFNARDQVVWREYEYYFPADMLLPRWVAALHNYTNDAGTNRETVVRNVLAENERSNFIESTEFKVAFARFSKAMKEMEGSHSFHNFHRLSKRALLPDQRINPTSTMNDGSIPAINSPGSDLDCDDVADIPQVVHHVDDNDNNDTDDKDIEDTDLDAQLDEADGASEDVDQLTKLYNVTSVFEDWQPLTRLRIAKTSNNMYVCESYLINATSGKDSKETKPMVKVLIRGQSFLLHQIRIMVGTAMHVGTGVLPEYMVKLAMLSSFHFVLPIAPANGLVLSTCGFGHPKSNTPAVHMHNFLSVAHNSGPHSSGRPTNSTSTTDSILVLDDPAYRACLQFKNDAIVPLIESGWERDDRFLVADWLRDSVYRYQIPGEQMSEFSRLYEEAENEYKVFLDRRRLLDGGRIEATIRNFQYLCNDQKQQEQQQHNSWSSPVGLRIKRDSKGRKAKALRPMPFRHFLPSGLTTALITHYRLVPTDDRITEANRILAYKMALGELSPGMLPEDVIAHVDKNGGFTKLLKHRSHDLIK